MPRREFLKALNNSRKEQGLMMYVTRCREEYSYFNLKRGIKIGNEVRREELHNLQP
jgi:hypothetical protein